VLKHGLVEAFLYHNIGMVLNLQEVGVVVCVCVCVCGVCVCVTEQCV